MCNDKNSLYIRTSSSSSSCSDKQYPYNTRVQTHTLVHNVLPWRHDENRRISPAALPKRVVTFISRVHINIVGPLYYLDPIGSPLAPRKYSWKSRFLSGAPPPPENMANCWEYTHDCKSRRGWGAAKKHTHSLRIHGEREGERDNINFKRASSTREMSPEYSPRYTYILFYTAGPRATAVCVCNIYLYIHGRINAYIDGKRIISRE